MLPGLLILFAAAAVLVIILGTLGLIYRMEHPDRLTLGVAIGRRMATEPSELGMTGRELTFRFPDDSTSPGWVIDGNEPAGPMVILVHGWSNSRLGALAKARRIWPHAGKVVVFDLRGHGESTARICEFGAAERDDIAAVMEQADALDDSGKGPRPVVLFGSSLGAGLAIAAATQGPEHLRDRIVGVVAEGPYRRPMEPIAGHLRAMGWPSQPFCFLTGVYLALRFGPRIGRFDRAELAAQLRRPLLVLHGCEDRICPIDSARQIAAAAPQGELVEFEAGGHGGLAALDETRYADALAAFFGRLGQADPPGRI
jgi:uncharacterized protein